MFDYDQIRVSELPCHTLHLCTEFRKKSYAKNALNIFTLINISYNICLDEIIPVVEAIFLIREDGVWQPFSDM